MQLFTCFFNLTYGRYELMSECWNEDPSSRPDYSELIDWMEVMTTRNEPYWDLDKHDESHPYYVPANTDEHSGLGIRKWQKGLQDKAQRRITLNFKRLYLTLYRIETSKKSKVFLIVCIYVIK